MTGVRVREKSRLTAPAGRGSKKPIDSAPVTNRTATIGSGHAEFSTHTRQPGDRSACYEIFASGTVIEPMAPEAESRTTMRMVFALSERSTTLLYTNPFLMNFW